MLIPIVLAAGVCPPVPETAPGDGLLMQMEQSWAIVNHEAKRNLTGTAEAGDPGQVGAWTSEMVWDVIAIHAALLPNGQVLQYSYPGGGIGSRARMWNPGTGAFTDVDMADDIFCSGLTHLADGRMYITGGNDYNCEFQGRDVTYIFDPDAMTWTPREIMEDGRWYPTNVVMADGRVLIFSGLDRECVINHVAEMFDPDAPNGAALTVVPNAEREVQLYPRMHILSDGRIAHVGEQAQTWTYDLDDGWAFETWNNFGWRCQGTSVLIPGRTDEIMIIGGNCPLTNTAEIIDFGDADPTYSYTTSMSYPRAHADAVILPDKTILVVGGGQDGLYDSPVNVPELYDPATDTWTELPAHAHGRMYHATSVLLPDGRVIVAGQDSGPGTFTGEIYRPAYLFRGPRPNLTQAPSVIQLGTSFEIESDQPLDALVLIKLTSVTHSVNFEQRMVELDLADEGDGVYTASLTSNPNVAIPGHYMLFGLNADGVPNEAQIVRISIDAPVIGDLNGDGLVDTQDMLILIGQWGPCDASCTGDLDGSGTVETADLLLLIGNWTI